MENTMPQRPRVAAVATIYHTWSHADAIISKFLKGYSTDEGFYEPEIDIVSLYIDHQLENDIGRRMAQAHGVPLYPSIRRALHAGSNALDVDGVLLIGEHGDYPWNERGRHLYPRRYLFEQIAGIFAESGRSVPVFNDKHFSYDFPQARWMWDRARQLDIPLMAGSCLPLAWRNPWLEHPLDSPIQAAVAVGYGGIEAYGYHAVESLLCMVERRRGGESGVRAVEYLEGEAVWQARDTGRFDGELALAAANAVEDRKAGSMEDNAKTPAVFLIEHSDGFNSAVLMLNGHVQHWSYAARLDGRVQASEFYLQPDGPGANFGYLCRNIARFMADNIAPYPPERTLLATGIVDAAMNARHEKQGRRETPDLDIHYTSYDTAPIRPTAPQPHGFSLTREAPDLLISWRQ